MYVICRPHVKYRPEKSIYEEPSSWWRYAYTSILNYYIKPYTWSHIIQHRRNYRKYKETCIQSLQRPNDTELKLDLQKYEDNLTILNIVIAREHARQELRNKDIERECQITTVNSSNIVNTENMSNSDETQNVKDQINKKENKKFLINVIDDSSNSKIKLEKTMKQIGKFKLPISPSSYIKMFVNIYRIYMYIKIFIKNQCLISKGNVIFYLSLKFLYIFRL